MNNNAASISVPVFSLDETGAVLPNTLFHQSWNNLHSHCIEYPYAASKSTQAKKLLNVGTANSNPLWLQWLDTLPGEVCLTDDNPSDYPYRHATFQQADVRKLPFKDNSFDVILAVSVIGCMGLDQAQLLADKPSDGNDDDVKAVRELIRILAPNGRLVMTFPYGLSEGLNITQSGRIYAAESLKRFERVAQPIQLEYYEYQHSQSLQRFVVNNTPKQAPRFVWPHLKREHTLKSRTPVRPPATSGVWPATWQRIPIIETTANNLTHIEGVVCSLWGKLP